MLQVTPQRFQALGECLPPPCTLEFEGDTWRENLQITRALCHGAIVTVNPDAIPGAHLNHEEANVLALRALGLDRRKTGEAMQLSPLYVSEYQANLLAKINDDPTFQNFVPRGIHRAIENGVLAVQCGAASETYGEDVELAVRELAAGYSLGWAARRAGLSAQSFERAIHEFCAERRIYSESGLILFGHAKGILGGNSAA